VAQAGLSTAEIDSIYGGNAVRLFGNRLADLPGRVSRPARTWGAFALGSPRKPDSRHQL